MVAHPLLRAGRALAFATVCVALAVAGHVAAGGAMPNGPLLFLGGGAALVAATLLAGRERHAAAITVTLVTLQAGLHELFRLGGTDNGTAGDGVAGVAGVVGVTGASHGGHGSGLGMTLAHLVAAVLTGLWLARGEEVVWSLLRRLGGLLPALLRPVTTPALWVPPARPARVPAQGPVRLRHTLSRRGPPPLRSAL